MSRRRKNIGHKVRSKDRRTRGARREEFEIRRRKCPDCKRKRSYRSKRFARDQARRTAKFTGDEISYYRGECGLWHIGHPPGWSKKSYDERRESVQANSVSERKDAE